MQSLGEDLTHATVGSTPESKPAGRVREPRQIQAVLREARDRERSGCTAAALERFERAVAMAEECEDRRALSQSLRGLAVALHRRGNRTRGRHLAGRSYDVARDIGDQLLAAEALNSLGAMELAVGSLEEARSRFTSALELGRSDPGLLARVETNLGIVANIQGDVDEALLRYRRSLDAYRQCGDQHGLSIAHHNLGMACADRELYNDAERHFTRSREIAERLGDAQMRALCYVNQADVDVARQRFEAALDHAEHALALFDQLREAAPKSGAYRVLGMVYREIGRPDLSEARLRSAIEIAARTGSVLNQAEATRELGLLYWTQKRNGEALQQLTASYRLFRRLDARRDLVATGAKIAELERMYLGVVREWVQSIETSDQPTLGHCERVAQMSVQIARALGLDAQEEKTILLGAMLHDIGKLRLPKEILARRGALTPEQQDLFRMHPTWGVELLADVDFPWEIKPIIRSHHERYDGSGYPDQLVGDEIPIGAQIVGLAERYDTLTTTHELAPEDALARIRMDGDSWLRRNVEALENALNAGLNVGEPAAV